MVALDIAGQCAYSHVARDSCCIPELQRGKLSGRLARKLVTVEAPLLLPISADVIDTLLTTVSKFGCGAAGLKYCKICQGGCCVGALNASNFSFLKSLFQRHLSQIQPAEWKYDHPKASVPKT